ncbi:MAG: Trm112 family protein [Myxococcales bacterium]|nr:Trm112 family protein [Myxococcales bacterium]
MAIHPELLDLVRCPKCRGELAQTAAGDGLSCAKCKLLYPVIDDIPQLLAEEARPIEG